MNDLHGNGEVMVKRTTILGIIAFGLMGCGPQEPMSKVLAPRSPDAISYYENITQTTGSGLREQLHRLIADAQVVDYEELLGILPSVVEAPDAPGQMRLFYSQRLVNLKSQDVIWNLEHVWPQSHGARGAAKSDLHHLQPCLNHVNSIRGNKDFLDLHGQGEEIEEAPGNFINNHQNAIEPREDIKGDIARMLFYMALRYDGGEGGVANLELVNHEKSKNPELGRLADLIQWNQKDPVDAAERQRNDRIYNLQKNRNPFIDHSEWVNEIWGLK